MWVFHRLCSHWSLVTSSAPDLAGGSPNVLRQFSVVSYVDLRGLVASDIYLRSPLAHLPSEKPPAVPTPIHAVWCFCPPTPRTQPQTFTMAEALSVLLQSAVICAVTWTLWKYFKDMFVKNHLDNIPGPRSPSWLTGAHHRLEV